MAITEKELQRSRWVITRPNMETSYTSYLDTFGPIAGQSVFLGKPSKGQLRSPSLLRSRIAPRNSTDSEDEPPAPAKEEARSTWDDGCCTTCS